ncbi:MAG: hypothetical protein ACT4OI_10580 [Methanobacteriota archaeon]
MGAGYLRNSQLRRQLEEKVKEATQARQVADESIASAREVLDAAKRIDADVGSAQKLLGDADAAMGGKDYKLASEKAKEALDRGREIYRERVEVMIKQGEALVGLAKSVGGSQDEAEATLTKAREALAGDELNAAVEHAKKAWKRGEKTLHEHLSSSFSRAQALILSAKNLKREVGLVEDLLSRARNAMESNDYEGAVGFTKEALDTITEDLRGDVDKEMTEVEELMVIARDLGADIARPASLIERARGDIANFEFEKARNTLRQCRSEAEKSLRLSLEGKAATFNKVLNETRGLGADPADAEEQFRAAEAAIRKGGYKEAAEAAHEGLRVLQEIQFQRVVQVIAASREKFVIAVNVGADLSGPMANLSKAREAFQRSAFAEAVAFARKADEDVEKVIGRFKAAEARLRDLHRSFAEAETLGVATAPARRLADDARVAYHNRDPDGLDRAITGAFEALARAEHEHTTRTIEQAEGVLSLGERNGADLGEASRLLEQAILATRAKDYRKALDLAGRATGQADAALATRVAETITALKEVLPHLGDEAAAIKVLLNRAEASAAAHDFDEAFGSLREAQTTPHDRVRALASAAVYDLATVVRMGVDLGADVAGLDTFHKEMNALAGAGRHLEVLGARERIRSTAATASDNLFNLVRNRVAQARELKIDIEEMRELLKRSKMAFGMESVHEGLLLLKECSEQAGRATAMYRQAQTTLSSAAALAAEARKRDVDVTKVLETLLEGKKAFERLDYGAAIDLAGRARAETEKLMVIYTSAQKILSSRERLDLAAKLGIPAPHLVESLGEAKEAMKGKDYARAVAGATRVETEVTGLLRERLSQMIADAEAAAASVPGVNLAVANEDLVRAKQSVEAGQFVPAVEAALRLADRLDRLRHQGDEATEALRRVRDLVADVGAMDVDAPETARLVDAAERAFRMGQFEETLDHVAQAEAAVARERDQGIAARMDRYQAAIDRAKRDGADTRDAETMLGQAREFLRGRKYRQARARAGQRAGEAGRIALRQPMAQPALQAAERKLGALEFPAPVVATALEEARKAFVGGDYVKALDGAIRAIDGLTEARNDFGEIHKTRERVTGLLRTAQTVGAEFVKLARISDEGEAALHAGDVARARAAFAQALEWGTGLIRAHLKEVVAKAEGAAATCRRLDLDATPALNRIAQAKGRIDAGEFEAAHGHLVEAQRFAEKALGGKLNEAFVEAAESLSHAKKLGSDSREAEAILREARERMERSEYESALELTERALEQAEGVKVVEKRFVDLTYKAESTIRSGRKFGIDMRAAENRLARSMGLRKSDLAEAIREAEEAYRLAWEAVEAFAPKIQGALEIGPAQLNAWADATLTLENVGRGLAKDVSVKVLGDAEADGLRDVPALRAGAKEVLPVRIKMTASGSVPLAIQITAHRVFDDKAYTQEMIAQVDVGEAVERPQKLVADLETRCPICKGMIKKGFKVLRCGCGRDFHELCATRIGRCPVCFRPIGAGAG